MTYAEQTIAMNDAFKAWYDNEVAMRGKHAKEFEDSVAEQIRIHGPSVITRGQHGDGKSYPFG